MQSRTRGDGCQLADGMTAAHNWQRFGHDVEQNVLFCPAIPAQTEVLPLHEIITSNGKTPIEFV